MNIILYSTNCPKCRVLEKKLEMKNIKFKTVTDVNLMLSRGIRTAPILEIDGTQYQFAEANQKINEI